MTKLCNVYEQIVTTKKIKTGTQKKSYDIEGFFNTMDDKRRTVIFLCLFHLGKC